MVKLPRRVIHIYVVTVVAYAVLGAVLLASAYATAEIPNSISVTPLKAVPTGNSDEVIQQYYDYLWLRHLETYTQTYAINPVLMIIIYAILGAVLVLTYFFTYAWYARLPKGDLYPVEVFNGYLSERGSPVDAFNWAMYAILATFMVWYIIWNLIFGQWM